MDKFVSHCILQSFSVHDVGDSGCQILVVKITGPSSYKMLAVIASVLMKRSLFIFRYINDALATSCCSSGAIWHFRLMMASLSFDISS